jgi:oligoendopeptidase F
MLTVAERRFVPVDFTINTWSDLEPYYQQLADRELSSPEALEEWLRHWSELEAITGEDACWRQIRMTCDTTDPNLEAAFNDYCLHIEPQIKPYTNRLQQKLADSPFTAQLDQDLYMPYLRNTKNALSLYREANVTLQAELNVLGQRYGNIAGNMMVTVEGKEYTLQQALKFLEHPDRNLRREVFTKINERRLQDKTQLDNLFDELLQKRHQVALNAGYENYRDYKFAELGRFDYTPEDCMAFHEAVKSHILPLQERLLRLRGRKLGLSRLAPYDLNAVAEGESPLQPFTGGADLLEKSIRVFDRLRPYYGDCLRTMQAQNRLDLDSRRGKAPGGYNCPLPETGVPFIFMNAAATVDDVITMMHEGGHAIHSFLAHPLPLTAFKEYPMEIAELASMSMELFSMDHWDVFFPEENELMRARQEELERVIDVLPWIAAIDKFQHWLYTHPGHAAAERTSAWRAIHTEFTAPSIDWSGLEAYRDNLWQKQLHLFEVPFYYIEYGIAQLGAVAMWRQYREDAEQALNHYEEALSLGYTRSLPRLYEAAGIRFAFDGTYISELKTFLEKELEAAGA